MRNLKRVLSLALALVMVLGMMVMTTSAAFADAEQITYVEAIDVTSGLGLFKGDEKGNVNPQVVLTRRDAATLMARIMLGEKTADKLIATKQIFADVDPVNDWGAKYIEYCYHTGLIGGYYVNGELVFNPDGKLTGIAMAKLLLCAMGYNADAQGYGGDDWASFIAADALEAKLTIAGVNVANELTREGAAQMILQALTGDMVRYIDSYDYATGAAVKTGPFATGETFMQKYFPGLAKVETDGTDKWGNPYDYKWTYKSKPLYTEWYTPVVEYFTAVDECDIVKDLDEDDEIEYTAYVNGKDNDVEGEWDDKVDKTVNYSVTGTGVWTRIYDTDEGYIAVAIDTYFAQVTKVLTEKTDKNGHVTREAGIELAVYEDKNAVTEYTEEGEDYFVTDDEFKKNEYVLVTICNGEIASAEPAEYVTETVKRITFEKNDRVMDTVTAKDGDVYGENVQFNCIYDAGEKEYVDELDTKVEYDLYLDEQGNIIAAIIPAPEAGSFLYGVITRINWVDTNDDDIDGYAKFNLMDMEAETQSALELTEYMGEDLEYADKNDAHAPSDCTVSTNRQDNKAWHDNLYEYELNKKTGTYEVSDVATYYEVYEVTADTRFEVEEDGEWYRANNATQFLIKTGKTSYEAVTGWKNVPELLAPKGETIETQYFVGKNDYLSMVFIDATNAIWAGASEMVFITDDEVTDEDDGLFEFKAYVGTSKKAFTLSEDMAEELGVEAKGDTLGLTGLYTLSFNAADEIIEFTPVDLDVLTVDGTEEGVLMVLEDEFDDFDIDEVPFYAIDGTRIVEGAADEVEGEEIYILTNAKGDKLVAVYYEA